MKKKLYRSNHGLICGVCTGFAEYFNVNPWIVRGIFLAIAMIAEFFPPMVYVVILAYLILALVMPKKPEQYNDVFTLLKDLFSGENRSGSDQAKRSQEQGRKIVTDAKERNDAIHHQMLDAAAHRPPDRDALADRLRDGRF